MKYYNIEERVTTLVQLAATPGKKGKRVYVSDTLKFYYWDGSAWQAETTVGVKAYKALLTQSGTSAPVATVLENSLGGTVVWAYSAVGTYTATLTGAFTAAKTAGRVTVATANGATAGVARTSANVMTITTADSTFAAANGILTAAVITIEVYA